MDYQIFNLLFRCSKEYSHKKIKAILLSDTEYMICSYVNSHSDCSQEDIAVALKTDKTTIGKAIASLEEKGCIIRVQDESDRRFKRISLTDKGKEKLLTLLDIHNSWLDQIMAALSKDEQQQFEDYCLRLLNTAENLLKKTNGDKSL